MYPGRAKQLGVLFVCCFFVNFNIYSQSPCDATVPSFTVNLTGSPDSVWTSPEFERKGNCCGTSSPDRCLSFVLTLDPATEAIALIKSGAQADYYYVDCANPTNVNSPLCLTGTGPFNITYCKSGSNKDSYKIQAIPKPSAPSSLSLNDGCKGTISVEGYDNSTLTWKTIYPGAVGAYNGYLSCLSGCGTTTVTAQAGYPPYVDVEVCGVAAGECSTVSICQTTRVSFFPTLFANITPVTPSVCFGQAGTNITVNGIGGSPPYSYVWSTGSSSQTIFVGAGVYTAILKDASNCPPTTANTTVVTFTTNIAANAGADVSVCAGSPTVTFNGSVVTASGGIWSGGGGTYNPGSNVLNASYTPTDAEIASGSITFTLTTTGNGSCPAATDIVRVSFINFAGTVNVSNTNTTCNGGTNGSATASVTGGVSPHTYSWNTSPVQNSSMATNLSPGNYVVTVTNAKGCTATGSITISNPGPLTTAVSQTNVSCFLGTNGSAAVTAFGGTPGYTYSWLPGGSTSVSISGLSRALYTITVTDVNGCIATNTVNITQPPIIASVISNVVNVSCKGGNDGSAQVTTTGGSPTYSYSWSPSGGSSPTATGLFAGVNVVTVTDINGCQGGANINITEPATAVTATVSGTKPLCTGSSNGTGTISASGGTPGYTYLWSPGGGTNTVATGLPAGNYVVTATDSKGCPVMQPLAISDPVSLSLTTNVINTLCGLPSGQANVGVSGGTSPYTYLWSTGSTAILISNVLAGTYSVTVTDANSCTQTANVTITNTNPFLGYTTGPNTDVSCYGLSNGTANVDPVDGVGAFSYLWSNGAITKSPSNLPAGLYTFTITDANTCKTTSTVVISQPASITVNASVTDASCNLPDGQASLSVSGGNSPYNFLWSTGGTDNNITNVLSGPYSVTVTDNSGCVKTHNIDISDSDGPVVVIGSTQNVSCYGGSDGMASASFTLSATASDYTISWSPAGGNTTIASGLTAGVYIVKVTDDAGCVGQATTNPEITEPPLLTASINKTNVLCKGASTGAAIADVSGGTSGYTYSWLPVVSAASSIGSLPVGNYTLTVKDSYSCSASAITTITEPALALTATITGTDVNCNGGNNGTGTLSVSGGTPLYSYNWLPYGGNSANATGLIAGTYTASVIDANGCTSASNTVTVTQPATPLTSGVTQTNVSCNGGSNGILSALASGGTAAYSYLWFPAGGTNSMAAGLSAGNYNVTVNDSKGCPFIALASISQPTAINVSTTNVNNAYCGQNNGQITAQVSGGTPAYSFLWTPSGGAGIIASNLSPGSYSVTVSDSKGCSASSSPVVNIVNTDGGTATIISTSPPSCYEGSNGSAVVSMTGGLAPFNYSWAPTGGISPTGTGLFAGTYTVTVTDNKGCASEAYTTITEPTQLIPVIASSTNVNCNGGNDGSATASASGGISPYLYSWSTNPVQDSSSAIDLSEGTYNLTVTDAQDCNATTSIIITHPFVLSSSIASYQDANCYLGNDGTATADAVGGTFPYTYIWNTTPAQTAQSAVNLMPGTHTVTVIDVNGCVSESVVSITEPTPVITIASEDDTICFGQSATISATATGGNGGYFYLWDQNLGIGNNFIVTPDATTAYAVVAYDAKGCIGTADAVTVYVKKLTPEALSVNGPNPICPGTSSFIYAAIAGSTVDTLIYTWNNGLGTGPGAFTISPLVPTTYVVTVRNTCGVVAQDSITITFKPQPSSTAAFDFSSGCIPLLVQFSDSSSSVDPIISWMWTFGDGGTSSQQNPSYIFNTAGTYSISLAVTSTGECVSVSSSANDTIQVLPLPVAGCSSDPVTAPIGTPVSFISNSPGGTSFFWDFGDGDTSNVANAQHSYEEPGFYSVTYTVSNQYDCIDTCSFIIIITGDILFPTIFTPKPDGSGGGKYDINNLDNDIFFPFAKGVAEFSLTIFDRWGELIFESNDLTVGWDGYYKGKICQQDVYVWKAEAIFIDGKKYKKAGNVTLLR